jgi:hypothetical protein
MPQTHAYVLRMHPALNDEPGLMRLPPRVKVCVGITFFPFLYAYVLQMHPALNDEPGFARLPPRVGYA